MSGSQDTAPVSTSPATGLRWRDGLCLLPVIFLWVILINHLRIEWTVNAQYNYGWAVPFLCVFLGWRAREHPRFSAFASGLSSALFKVSGLLVIALALIYAPTRLVQEANPEWRFVSWALALIVVGLTLVFVRGLFGARVVGWSAFPILFFLVAVPWPTLVEAPVIQRLTELNAVGAVEVLNLLGIPALRHGNVIEISTGLVGIEDACSGIRSFQACLMISLFLGEYHRLHISRRVALIGAGFLLAVLFNLGRTVLLVTVSSRKGIPAMAQWHDPAGVTILVGCFLGVWLLSLFFARRGRVPDQPLAPETFLNAMSPRPRRGVGVLAMGLLVWLIACEVGVAFWYGRHESEASAKPTWKVRFPADAPQFRELPLEARTVQLLRFDEGKNASWLESDGSRYQMIFLRWNPGRVAVHLARSHTPEVCLTAAGHKISGEAHPRTIEVAGLSLRFDVYRVANEGLWVYYCLWEDGFSSDSNETEMLTYKNRLRPVMDGRRNRGQRSLEIAVRSNATAEEIEAKVRQLVQSAVQIAKSPVEEPRPVH